MKQTRYQQLPSCQERIAFDRIPDEILVHILAQPIIDLPTLGIVMNLSERFRQLVMRVLCYYRLPAIEMALSIDQEGKSRITNRFEFSHFCNMTCNAVFVNAQPIPKRYYTNKACPVVRLIAKEDYYMRASQLQSEMPPAPTSSSFMPVQQEDDCKEKALRTSQKRSHSYDSIIQKPAAMSTDSNSKVQNYKLQAQKEGLHILQVTPLQSRIFQLPNMGASSWRMAYQVSNKERHEYYLTPTNFCIRLEQLFQFEQKANHINNKTPLGMNRMINWLYRLK
jgi:hypothetical protein